MALGPAYFWPNPPPPRVDELSPWDLWPIRDRGQIGSRELSSRPRVKSRAGPTVKRIREKTFYFLKNNCLSETTAVGGEGSGESGAEGDFLLPRDLGLGFLAF